MEDGLQQLATQALARLVENIDSYNFVSNDSEWQEVWHKDYDDKSGTCSLCGAMGELDFLQSLSCVSRDLATAVRNVLSELSKSATEQAYHPGFQSWVAQLCPGAMAGAKQLFTEKSAAVAMCCFHLGIVYSGEGPGRLNTNLIGELSKCPRLAAFWINGHGLHPSKEEHASIAQSFRLIAERCAKLFHLDLNYMFRDKDATAHVDALMQHLSTHAHELEVLVINCNAVSPVGLRALKEGLPKLIGLDISHIPQHDENNAAIIDLLLTLHERNPLKFEVVMFDALDEPMYHVLRAKYAHINVRGY